MKNIILLSGICLFLASCAPYFYQLSSIRSNDVLVDSNNRFYYEDSLVKISYNLWSDGGTMSFKIYNKTNVPIYIDWSKSNFIRNGNSVDYWQDVETTKSVGASVTTGSSNSKGSTTSTEYPTWYAFPRTVNSSSNLVGDNNSISGFASISFRQRDKPNNQIPPHSFIIVNRFNINTPFWLLPKYPEKNDSIVMKYDSSNSVLSFRNYIAFTKNQDLSNVKFIDNSFWVDKITCMNYKRYNDAVSGLDTLVKEKFLPNRFYTVVVDGFNFEQEQLKRGAGK